MRFSCRVAPQNDSWKGCVVTPQTVIPSGGVAEVECISCLLLPYFSMRLPRLQLAMTERKNNPFYFLQNYLIKE